MDEKSKAFQKRLLDTFRMEAEDHLREMILGLTGLEQNPDAENRATCIENIFREVHSLKGAARSVDLYDIEAVCQPLEDVFSMLKRRNRALPHAILDLVHLAVSALERIIVSLSGKQSPVDRLNLRTIIKQLHDAAHGTELRETPLELSADAVPASGRESISGSDSDPDPSSTGWQMLDKPTLLETVRVPAARLDAIFVQTEEMILVKLASDQLVAQLKEIDRTIRSWRMSPPIRDEKNPAPGASPGQVTQALNATSLTALQNKVTALRRKAEQDLHTLRRVLDEHMASMKQVMMLPVASLVEAFPKVVRDLARNQNKDAELVLTGAEIEIDKRILEELKDPFIHLFRNYVDHGLRKPDERAASGKPRKGTIRLDFSIRDGRQLEAILVDDGEGIDISRLREVSLKAGLLTRDTAGDLGESDILPLIFQSGISTSPIITDLSGRGLGLAIVREKVEKLGGIVSVRNLPGAGTTFSLTVPLTLATFRGVLVRIAGHFFLLPILNIAHVMLISPEEIGSVENHQTIKLGGQVLPLVKLANILALTENEETIPHKIPVAVVVSGNKCIAFQVDEILDEQQVLVKGLGGPLKRLRNIAGSTVLGTGRVVPILNVPDLMKSAVRLAEKGKPVVPVKKAAPAKAKILIAEDSITSRTLIRNILETAGFKVATAVDGLDALTQVRSSEFDLVVSDVDMPQMSGFELTSKIRGDKRLSELPVVLVTALESREDRERGIEVGANAYIIKSSFDQSNLLEVVRKLI